LNLPKFISFTGLDERTDLERANKLAQQYPIEWAILYGNPDNGPRYPATPLPILTRLRSYGTMLVPHQAVHFCGVKARNFPVDYDKYKRFGRIQVNAPCETDLEVILQHKSSDPFPLGPSNVCWLHDESGGHGQVPTKRPTVHKGLVGYAGGIGPDNVQQVLMELDIGPQAEFYIDMETKIRTNDWLNLDLCEEVCKLVYK